MASLSLLILLASEQGVYPGADWQVNPTGLKPEIVRRLNDYLPGMDTTSMVVVKGGKIVYQYGDTKLLSYLASSRKSILSMLYGKYVANGTIDLDKTLKDLGMTDHGGLLPIEETAKVRHLIPRGPACFTGLRMQATCWTARRYAGRRRRDRTGSTATGTSTRREVRSRR